MGVGNPAAGAPLTGAEVTARDGRTKHKWTTWSDGETCFESRLDDMRGIDARELRYELVAFESEDQPLAKAPTLQSSRVLLEGEDQAVLQTSERAVAIPSATLDICFANPGRAIKSNTKYVVLRVPWSRDDEAQGAAGSRDGAWRLQPATTP